MKTSRVSSLLVSRASKPLVSRVKAGHPVSVVTVQSAQNVMPAEARRVDGSAMTIVRRAARVRTSLSV